MRKPCSTLLLCMLLCFGLSLVVRAEDVAETAYDESETLPLRDSSLFSNDVLPEYVRGLQTLKSGSSFHLSFLTRHRERRADRSAHPISGSLIILDHSIRC